MSERRRRVVTGTVRNDWGELELSTAHESGWELSCRFCGHSSIEWVAEGQCVPLMPCAVCGEGPAQIELPECIQLLQQLTRSSADVDESSTHDACPVSSAAAMQAYVEAVTGVSVHVQVCDGGCVKVRPRLVDELEDLSLRESIVVDGMRFWRRELSESRHSEALRRSR